MKQMTAPAFQQQCLSLLDHVDSDGIVITKDGKPVAKLVPFAPEPASRSESPESHFGIRGKALPAGQEWGC
jgi:prevent-host-death family protein